MKKLLDSLVLALLFFLLAGLGLFAWAAFEFLKPQPDLHYVSAPGSGVSRDVRSNLPEQKSDPETDSAWGRSNQEGHVFSVIPDGQVSGSSESDGSGHTATFSGRVGSQGPVTADESHRENLDNASPGESGSSAGIVTSQRRLIRNTTVIEPEALRTLQTGYASISGRVVDQQGRAVLDAIVRLRRYSSGRPNDAAKWAGTPVGSYGDFLFTELDEGDYKVSVLDTKEYQGVERSIRTGASSVDLVVNRTQSVQISGVVLNSAGEPVNGVVVTARMGSSRSTANSMDDGRYALSTTAAIDRQLSVTYQADGYEDLHLYINPESFSNPVEKNVELTSLANKERISVNGMVLSENGKGLDRGSVTLRSAIHSVNQSVTTASDGTFTLDGIVTGGGYELLVRRIGYIDYRQSSIDIASNQPAVKVHLTPVERGNLSGVFLDSEGTPIPGMIMDVITLGTTSKSVRIIGDDSGAFETENITSGKLRFYTRTEPKFTISGVELDAGQDLTASLVVDYGEFALEGQLVDGDYLGIAEASVRLSWEEDRAGIKFKSERSTISDENGTFRFTQLGPGPHNLLVTQDGYQMVKKRLDTRNQYDSLIIEMNRK